MLYVFDIDGTIADISHRLHFITKPEKDWTAFYLAAAEDQPIWDTITVARALAKAGHRVIYITGRSEDIRGITNAWLLKYRVPQGSLYMRKANDYREDFQVKSEILDKILNTPGFENIDGVFEDRQQVVDMYRARGIRVFQCAKGDF
jgi:hypothetical protein